MNKYTLQDLNFDWNLKENFFIKISLLSFSVVATSFSEMGLVPIFFIILFTAFILHKKPSKSLWFFKNYPIEMHFLNIWIIYAFFSGVFVSYSWENFFDGINKTIFYILICNLIVLTLLNNIKLIIYIIWGLFIGALLQVLAVKLNIGMEYVDRTGRAVGFGDNPNALGVKMVYGLLAIIFFMLKDKINILKKVIYVLAAYLIIESIFFSGSRKALLASLILLIFFFPLYLTRKTRKIKGQHIVAGLFVITIFVLLLKFYLPYFLEGTVVGDRIEMGADRGGVEGDIRYSMYEYGLQLFYEYPLFGVGFNNFRNYFYTGQYSHSDYIESLSCTGIIGFILYQAIYLIVLFRAIKIFFESIDNRIRLYAAFVILSILVIKILGTGIILFYVPAPLILFGLCSVLSLRLKTINQFSY